MKVEWIDDCPWCARRHTTTFLCPPAGQMLELELAKRRASGLDMQTINFDQPVEVSGPSARMLGQLGLGKNDSVMKQLMVMSALTPVPGITDPVATLILTGRDLDDRPLPRWVYMGSAAELRGAADLFRDRAEHAIGRAHPGSNT